MKETLLQRCQREADSKIYARNFNLVQNEYQELLDMVAVEIANTLKQAAESLEGLRKERLDYDSDERGYNQCITEAQKLIRGELDITL